jgi:hypothetical protein
LAADGNSWNLYGKFVSKSGNVSTNRILICDSTKQPMIPLVAFDGTDYLITWIETVHEFNIKGRFFDQSGSPVDTAFIVFDTLGGKFPTGGVGGFIQGHYFFCATRIDSLFLDGDVYIKTLDPLVTGIGNNDNNKLASQYILKQNFPNPFNPSTIINYSIPKAGIVTIKVFDVLGKEVATLIHQEKSAGNYSVQFSESKLTSRIYFYRMQVCSFVQTKKLLLLK